MHLHGVEVILNRSSTFVLDGIDVVSGCKFNIIKDKGIGTETPIIVRGKAVFRENVIRSELDYPILQQSSIALVADNIIILPKTQLV